MLKSTLVPLRLDHAAEMLKAMAHPMRLNIVKLICKKGSCTVSQIQEALDLEQAVVSQHLSILKTKDVLICERDGRNSVYSLKFPCLSTILDALQACNS
jgi:DNA-binding transcriptional ArsR family regulator